MEYNMSKTVRKVLGLGLLAVCIAYLFKDEFKQRGAQPSQAVPENDDNGQDEYEYPWNKEEDI